MGDYFKPWRRKIGVMMLLMACVFAAGWVRSLDGVNRFSMKDQDYRLNWFASFNGSIFWQRVVPLDASKWSTQINEYAVELFDEYASSVAEYLFGAILSNEDQFQWKYRFLGFEIGETQHDGSMGAVRVTIWKLSYSWLVIPLTLISCWLFLSKPRRSESKSPIEPVTESVG